MSSVCYGVAVTMQNGRPRTLHSGNKRTHTLTPLCLIVSSQQFNHKFIVPMCSEIVHFFNLLFQKV